MDEQTQRLESLLTGQQLNDTKELFQVLGYNKELARSFADVSGDSLDEKTHPMLLSEYWLSGHVLCRYLRISHFLYEFLK